MIGFRVIRTYDYSRTYRPKLDYAGKLNPGNIYRPMQITVWYPAGKATQAATMRQREYAYLWATEREFGALTEEKKNAAILKFKRSISLFFPAGLTAEKLDELLDTPTAAVKDAKPQPGRFPLIINASDAVATHSVVSEYLASHGYVVASFPLLGVGPGSAPAFWIGRRWFEVYLNDIQFTASYLRQLSFVNPDKLAIIGTVGGPAGLVYQMRNMNVDALVSIDGRYDDDLKQSPYFDAVKMRTPLLHLANQGDSPLSEGSLLDSLKYAQRSVIKLPDLSHPDLYSLRMISQTTTGNTGLGYEIICRYTLAFLDAHVKGAPQAHNTLKRSPKENGWPTGLAIVQVKEAQPAPPTEDEFLTMVMRPDGIRQAVQVYREVKAREPEHTIFQPRNLSNAGRQLLGRNRVQEAIEVFKLNIEAQPRSVSALNELANVYLEVGQKEMSAQQFEKALELLPNDPSQNNKQKEQLKAALQQKLTQLKQGK